MSGSISIGFIGAGTVGTALGVTLSRRGYRVAAVNSRTTASAERFAHRVGGVSVCQTAQQVTELSNLVFVTTPDDAIAGVVREITWKTGLSVVHCNGSSSIDILEHARQQGAAVGAFHPLQSFASVEQAIENLPGSTFALEGEEPLLSELVALASTLDGVPVVLKPGEKVLYHAAAVIVSNYAVALMKMANDLWQGFGVDDHTATKALLPLLRGTVNNIATVGLPNCLTGPIARGDIGTVEKHVRALKERAPAMLPVYCELGLQAIPVAVGKGKIDADRADALRRLLSHWRSIDSVDSV
ncbi:MAG: DUF2520 domain-containing protein [Chloroflexi bacterium]|nr:DUF2520 domain-containing protein [Chloroflexota bacterium]